MAARRPSRARAQTGVDRAEPVQTSTPTPWSLRLAAFVVCVEGLGAVVAGVWMLAQTIGERPRGLAIALSTAGFVLVAGALLGVLAVALYRRRRWSRGPTACVQLLMLPIGYELVEPPTNWIGYAMLVLAVVTLVMLLLPSSTAVFHSEREPRTF